jgi:hypothetical protein
MSEKLNAYVAAVVATQQTRVRDTLARITESHRHLLALRGYIRMRDRIEERWPMSDADEEAFRNSPAYERFRTEQRQIFAEFARRNPGHSLRATVEARTLEEQIRLWNGNATVEGLGRDLQRRALRELAGRQYPEEPTEESTRAFSRWLGNSNVSFQQPTTTESGERTTTTIRSPSNATPGLSSHGVFRALDFQIYRGNVRIAGTVTSTARRVWDAAGWTDRLREAIHAISDHWEGPLHVGNLYEPWHYTYNDPGG